MHPLTLNQSQEITFVMVNNAYTEVAGLGNTFTLELRKPGGVFVGSTGVKSEIANGWYSYVTTAAECDTRGPLSIKVTGAGCIQQNLEYYVETHNAGCNVFTYTVLDSITLLPIAGADVWISTDAAGANIIWRGLSDAFGVARDLNDILPCLDTGVYFVFKQRPGYAPDAFPDLETVP